MVNPFDRFGDHLRLALRAPASYQLLTWLESGPGAALPKRGEPPTDGRWVRLRLRPVRPGGDRATCAPRGYDVTIVEPGRGGRATTPTSIVGDGYEPHVLAAVAI